MLVNFEYDKEKWQQFRLLAMRESRTVKSIITEVIDEYLKIHKEGNPQHLITLFTENEDIQGFSAVGINNEKKQKWIDKNPKLKEEMVVKIQEWKFIFEKNGYRF